MREYANFEEEADYSIHQITVQLQRHSTCCSCIIGLFGLPHRDSKKENSRNASYGAMDHAATNARLQPRTPRLEDMCPVPAHSSTHKTSSQRISTSAVSWIVVLLAPTRYCV